MMFSTFAGRQYTPKWKMRHMNCPSCCCKNHNFLCWCIVKLIIAAGYTGLLVLPNVTQIRASDQFREKATSCYKDCWGNQNYTQWHPAMHQLTKCRGLYVYPTMVPPPATVPEGTIWTDNNNIQVFGRIPRNAIVITGVGLPPYGAGIVKVLNSRGTISVRVFVGKHELNIRVNIQVLENGWAMLVTSLPARHSRLSGASAAVIVASLMFSAPPVQYMKYNRHRVLEKLPDGRCSLSLNGFLFKLFLSRLIPLFWLCVSVLKCSSIAW